MVILYNIGIFIYSLLIRIASLFNRKAHLFVKGRKNWQSQLKAKIDTGKRYTWFHCASLGEFEQCRPVLEEVKLKLPEKPILLTFFSPSGYEIRKNYPHADVVCYLPVDTKRNVKKFLDIVNPETALFIKYEFWYHYITEVKKRGIPLYSVSAIFREGQHFFKPHLLGKWYRRSLKAFSHFFVQNQKSAELLAKIGISNYTITGDTRFDRVAAIASSAKSFPVINEFKVESQLIIIGSSWKPDEELITRFINNHKGNTKFIIAPHEVSENNINRIQQSLTAPSVRFSQKDEINIVNNMVLVIDSIGILSSLYQYGDIAYIGGGFGVGIHNILEAATYGIPVVFGPNYTKFDEACNLIAEGGAFSINSYKELGSIFEGFLNNKGRMKEAGKSSLKFIEKNLGATPIIIKKVFNI